MTPTTRPARNPSTRPEPHRDATPGLVAGAALLLMSALAGFGYLFAIEGLITEGDATRTATDILASRGLFRSGVVSLWLVIALDVVVAWALYRVFRPVSRRISLLAAWLRIVYTALFAAAVTQLVGVLALLPDTGAVAAPGAQRWQVEALLGIDRFTAIWDAGLILFGLHLLVIAWLALRSGDVPKLLGLLLGAAGFGYVFDSIGALLPQAAWPELSSVTFVGEFLLAVWLVTRGRRAGSSAPDSALGAPATTAIGT